MDKLKIYSQSDVTMLINIRAGEQKLGENVLLLETWAELEKSTAEFVIFGIPEDIGVRANFGNGGAKTAWLPALSALLNMQSNAFLTGRELLVLGHLEIVEPEDQSMEGLRAKVEIIDHLVYPIVEKIITSGKIPIIIGGGHNNARGIIWGASLAYGVPMNVVNIDAHADLRKAEGRHSGNGFTYALHDGHLAQYRIFGLQQPYVHADLPGNIAKQSNLKIAYFEHLLKSQQSIPQAWNHFINDLEEPCGLEIDLDSIANVLSSASSPTGFALNDIRTILLAETKKFSYLHLCEGATIMAHGRKDVNTGKTIAFLISDFIKALLPHTSQQPSS